MTHAELARLVHNTVQPIRNMYGNSISDRLYGPASAAARQTILSAIRGHKVPKAECGHRATVMALYGSFNVQADCIANMITALDVAVAAALPEQPQGERDVMEGDLGDGNDDYRGL